MWEVFITSGTLLMTGNHNQQSVRTEEAHWMSSETSWRHWGCVETTDSCSVPCWSPNALPPLSPAAPHSSHPSQASWSAVVGYYTYISMCTCCSYAVKAAWELTPQTWPQSVVLFSLSTRQRLDLRTTRGGDLKIFAVAAGNVLNRACALLFQPCRAGKSVPCSGTVHFC